MSKTMKEMYEEGRPYEKCLTKGAKALSDAELLGVILRTGTSGTNVCDLASQILSLEGYEGLHGLNRIPLERLLRLKGIGKVKAVQIRCLAELAARMAKTRASEKLSFTDPASIADYFMEELRYQEQEQLMALFLNTKNRLLREKLMFRGTVNASILSPREVFLEAFEVHAVSIVLIHNHPSGDPTPSKEDIRMTQRVACAGDLIGIQLLDHVIIGDRCYRSMREMNMLGGRT